jgi:hypothetical protein
MKVRFGRRLAALGATELEEVNTKRWIKGTLSDLLLNFFPFIYFGMFGVL